MLSELLDRLTELGERAGLGVNVRAVGAVAAVLCALGVWWAFGRWAQPSGPTVAEPPAAPVQATRSVETSSGAGAKVVVDVVGAVRRPGVYDLPGGSRARDAVAAAGGLLGDAAADAVNLARIVADGEQLVVPTKDQAAAPTGGGTVAAGGAAGGAPAGKVDLNAATAEQLDALPGVGPATAAKIVAERAANGPFHSVDDLQRVPGIGPKKADALKDLVTVK